MERLDEAGVTPVEEDRAEIAGHLAQGAGLARGVREQQLAHVSAAMEAVATEDAHLTGRLLVHKDSHAAPAARSLAGGGPLLPTVRRSGAATGGGGTKSFAGVSMDERKATQAAKQAMLAASFLGYKSSDGTFVQSARVSPVSSPPVV